MAWGIALALAALGAWTLYQRNDAVRDERERVEQITEERSDDISEAINGCDGLPWYERLQCNE